MGAVARAEPLAHGHIRTRYTHASSGDGVAQVSQAHRASGEEWETLSRHGRHFAKDVRATEFGTHDIPTGSFVERPPPPAGSPAPLCEEGDGHQQGGRREPQFAWTQPLPEISRTEHKEHDVQETPGARVCGMSSASMEGFTEPPFRDFHDAPKVVGSTERTTPEVPSLRSGHPQSELNSRPLRACALHGTWHGDLATQSNISSIERVSPRAAVDAAEETHCPSCRVLGERSHSLGRPGPPPPPAGHMNFVRQHLMPVGAQMNAMRETLQQSADEVSAEVQALTQRLTTNQGACATVKENSRERSRRTRWDSEHIGRSGLEREHLDRSSGGLETGPKSTVVDLGKKTDERSGDGRDRDRVEDRFKDGALKSRSAQSGTERTLDQRADERGGAAPPVSGLADVLSLKLQVVQLQESLDQAERELSRRPSQQCVTQLEQRLEQSALELSSRPSDGLVQQLKEEIAQLERQLRVERGRRFGKHGALSQTSKNDDVAAASREELEHMVRFVHTTLRVDFKDAERALQQLVWVVERHLPQLEKFVGDVFHLVETDSGGGQSLDKETVLDTLRRWREGPSGRTWGLSEDLRRPSERRKSESFRNELAVPCARELSARVRHRETTQDMWKAKAHCNSSGCRIVSHFMQLFEVRTVDDVLPAMNAAFTRLSELSTLHHAVCDALRLDSAVTVGEAITQLWRFCQSAR